MGGWWLEPTTDPTTQATTFPGAVVAPTLSATESISAPIVNDSSYNPTTQETTFPGAVKAANLLPLRKAFFRQQIIAVGVGDSLTAGAYNSGSYYSYLTREGSQFVSIGNLAVGGYTIEQIAPQIPAAIALRPDVIFLCAGGNNAISNLITPGAVMPIYEGWIQTILSAGITPILVTLPPSATAGKVPTQSIFNGVLAYWAMKYNVPFFDPWDSIRDDTTGNYIGGASPDGTHPSWASIKSIIDLELPKFLAGQGNTYPINYNPLISGQLITNPFFTTDTNADGLSDGWTKNGTGAVATTETESGILGKWQKLAFPSNTGGASLVSPAIAGSEFTAGDICIAAAKCKSEGLVNRYATNYFNFGGTLRYVGERGSTSQATWSGIAQRWTAFSKFTAPTTGVGASWTFALTGTQSAGDNGAGNIWINRPQIINLTRLGLE